jgi:Protein of unknown function (DUF1524)
VLSLLGRSSLPEQERDGIFVDLESFLIRRMICGRTSKNYNRLFLQLGRDFETKGEATRAAFHDLLAAGAGDAVDWPSDEDFRTAWMTVDAYSDLKPARVEMVLRALDAAMTTAKTESITIHGKLTVEHVMPQEWRKHWPLEDGGGTEAEERRESMIHDFGNLTLITQPLNSAVSNGPAAKKLSEIALSASLRLNSYFQGRTTWSEHDIHERGEKLFAVAKTVWPGP